MFLRHPIYLSIYLVFLSFMGVFITASIGSTAAETSFAEAEVPFAVIDRDNSDLSRGLTTYLEGSGEQIEVADESFALQDAVATGLVDYVLVIPEGYGEDFVDAARAGTDEPLVDYALSYSTLAGSLAAENISQYMGLVRSAAILEPQASLASLVASAHAASNVEASVETVQTAATTTPADQFAFYLQWSTYTITATIVVCVGLLMSAFNRTDVRRRNLSSPLSSLRLGLAQAAGCLAVTLLACTLACGFGLVAFGSTLAEVPAGAVALVLLCVLVFATCPLSLGFMLGQLGASEMVANAVGNIAGMVLAFLGGAWISLDLMSAEVQTAAHFTPTYWFVDAVDQAIHLTTLTPATVAPVLGNLGVVALFTCALLAVALAAGRMRMRSNEAGGNAAAKAI